MQNILRNNLWMIMVAWCLLLNGYSILSIITVILASVYLMAFNSNMKLKRMVLVGIINFILFYALGSITVSYKFNYFNLFAMVISINVSLLNERLNREKLHRVYKAFIASFTSLIIFLIASLIITNNFLITSVKTSIYALIVLIFIPYTSEMLISLIKKEYNKKRFLDKLKTNNQ